MSTVTTNTPLIHVASGTYPVYLSGIRKYVPNVSIGEVIDITIIKELGFDLAPTPEPRQADVEYINTRRQIQAKKSVMDSLNAALAKALSSHIVDINGSSINVDLNDITILSNILVEATLLNATGKTYIYRDADKVIHSLDADSVTALVEAASVRYNAIYAKYWMLKDQITAAETAAAAPAIPVEL